MQHTAGVLRGWGPVCAAAGALLCACGGDRPGLNATEGIVSGGTGEPEDATTGDGDDDVDPPRDAESTGNPIDPSSSSGGSDESSGGPACTEDCGDGECIDGQCCAVELVCSGVCCPEAEVCSFEACVAPGADCVDASECEEDEYCEYALGEPAQDGAVGVCPGGASLATGKCLPRPPECAEGVEPDFEDGLDCLPRCEVIPEGSFEPELKFHWDLANPMMAPIVVQLDDDNCDFIIDEKDIPEIVFTTFESNDYNNDATLHAISIVEGEVVTKWSTFLGPEEPEQLDPAFQLAAGDIDGLPGNEIVACSESRAILAFDGQGQLLWTAPGAGCDMPSLADFDQDGVVEVLTRGGIYDGPTGALEVAFTETANVIAADVDSDGFLEVVRTDGVYEADGTQVSGTPDPGASHVAVGDFDLDSVPEIVTLHRSTIAFTIWRLDPLAAEGYEVVRSGVDVNAGQAPCSDSGGGPLTIADFDGDGTPDIGTAAGLVYSVFDGAALMNPAVANEDTVMWFQPTIDCSSRNTGSSVFDFDGDGSAEVVYNDQEYLRVYRGTDGAVLYQTCSTTGTLREYPLVADVDNDGHADIVAIANDYSSITCPDDGSKQRGVRVFGDTEGRWVRTRRIWNQHAYHVTNVEEDGSIPAVEASNWSVPGLNNFRQNVQPDGEFSAPDLIGRVLSECGAEGHVIVARVRNVGQAAVPPGVVVGIYAGDPAFGAPRLGEVVTTKALYSAEAEDLPFAVPDDAPPALAAGELEAYIIVDDGPGGHTWTECRLGNNTAHAAVECTPAG